MERAEAALDVVELLRRLATKMESNESVRGRVVLVDVVEERRGELWLWLRRCDLWLEADFLVLFLLSEPRPSLRSMYDSMMETRMFCIVMVVFCQL